MLYLPLLKSELAAKKALVSSGLSPNLRDTSSIVIAALIVMNPNAKTKNDGYWVILEPLTPGNHDIHFKASLTNPTTGILFYNDDVKYNINVL